MVRALEPWYKAVTLRREVSEGRSFSPDEFAIALEQVVAGTAPSDYCDPEQFFSRTCFTRALGEHCGMVLRRLSGETANTSPVLTLITQFGGGKTHTLASLFHLAGAGEAARALPGVAGFLRGAGISRAPAARVGVFVGNAWDPSQGRETPWIDLARQLAGDRGVEALGGEALSVPPGTEALSKVFSAADAPVLLLFDEVLNFVNRHRSMAETFHAFVQNLTVAVTGATHAAAVISLPRSQVEMTQWDQQWQERITKVVRRVARDLIANDESEISEIVRRRLFEDLGSGRERERVADEYADWCCERSARLPSEWTAVDSAAVSGGGRDFLRERFEACYPFHPATLSVFQRKWRALPQFQQTRGALAMLAQWVSWAAREQFRQARREPLITLGSAPLHVPEFRAVVLGQLGESRLDAAIDADIAGDASHAAALDADTKGPLRGIHRRVGAAILFESSGGQVEKVAHLPELRFALGEPQVDTASVDTAAAALEKSGFFVRGVGADGYRIHHQATLRKVVNDRRASLHAETEVKPKLRELVKSEFERGAAIPVVSFPADGDAVADTSRLTLVVLDPDEEWHDSGPLARRVAQWTRQRNESPRLYPSALIWCARKPGRELTDSVEWLLAWRRVASEISQGTLGAEFEQAERADVQTRVQDALEAVKDAVWACYRFAALSDPKTPPNTGAAPELRAADGLRVIDLGAGHSSSSDTLCGRVVTALKSEGLLSDSVGAGYIERHWPPAFADSGEWPLVSLRQSFFNGALTRLADPDRTIRRQVASWVEKGEFGLASGGDDGRSHHRVWYGEPLPQEEIAFEPGVFLLTKTRSRELAERAQAEQTPYSHPDGPSPHLPHPVDQPSPTPESPSPSTDPPQPNGPNPAPPAGGKAALRVAGTLPAETWNRFGRSILPKLHASGDLEVSIELLVDADPAIADNLQAEISRGIDDLTLTGHLNVELAPRQPEHEA